MTHRSNEGFLPFARLFLSIEFVESILLNLLWVDDLIRLEALEYLVLDLEEMHCELLMQGIIELLCHEHKQIEYMLLCKHSQQLLVQASLSLMHKTGVFWNLEKLLKEHDDQFDHLVLLFVPLSLLLHDFHHVVHES